MKKIVLSIAFLIVLFSACIRKYPLELGGNYRIDYDGNSYFYLLDSNNTVIVASHILEYVFDSTFIIVSQRPWDITGVIGLDSMTYRERNRVFENSKFKQYWIINKKLECTYSYDSINKRAKYSNVYGPYNKEMYIKMREELGVPKGLQLKEK